jgi:single-strand selective monofunctional uracil DNA glycosylase
MPATLPLVQVSRRLARRVGALSFAEPVTHVYNPLEYARRPHEAYLETWGQGPKEVLLVGMNPGPFGMAQTGVPFGDVGFVRDFLKIDRPVKRPEREHPKRPIEGLACPRREVSGRRLWGLAEDLFGTPERFFERFFVLNYCPLCFMGASGKNLTPDKLPAEERAPLFAACDEALAEATRLLEPRVVVGVGAFATNRCRAALPSSIRVGTVLHPSPASPRANRDWAGQARRELEALGIKLPGVA